MGYNSKEMASALNHAMSVFFMHFELWRPNFFWLPFAVYASLVRTLRLLGHVTTAGVDER